LAFTHTVFRSKKCFEIRLHFQLESSILRNSPKPAVQEKARSKKSPHLADTSKIFLVEALPISYFLRVQEASGKNKAKKTRTGRAGAFSTTRSGVALGTSAAKPAGASNSPLRPKPAADEEAAVRTDSEALLATKVKRLEFEMKPANKRTSAAAKATAAAAVSKARSQPALS
jgi:hypothetical protein